MNYVRKEGHGTNSWAEIRNSIGEKLSTIPTWTISNVCSDKGLRYSLGYCVYFFWRMQIFAGNTKRWSHLQNLFRIWVALLNNVHLIWYSIICRLLFKNLKAALSQNYTHRKTQSLKWTCRKQCNPHSTFIKLSPRSFNGISFFFCIFQVYFR